MVPMNIDGDKRLLNFSLNTKLPSPAVQSRCMQVWLNSGAFIARKSVESLKVGLHFSITSQ